MKICFEGSVNCGGCFFFCCFFFFFCLLLGFVVVVFLLFFFFRVTCMYATSSIKVCADTALHRVDEPAGRILEGMSGYLALWYDMHNTLLLYGQGRRSFNLVSLWMTSLHSFFLVGVGIGRKCAGK